MDEYTLTMNVDEAVGLTIILTSRLRDMEEMVSIASTQQGKDYWQGMADEARNLLEKMKDR